MDKIKLGCLNVRGIQMLKKRNEMFNFFRQKSCDIVCLQETHFTEDDYDVIQKKWGGAVFCSYDTNRSAGVAILIKKICKKM